MMARDPLSRLQWLVFALAAAVFTTVYIPQPVLPILRQQFGVSAGAASLTVSAVVLGMALANLPFGALADRLPIRPILLTGGLVIAVAGLASALRKISADTEPLDAANKATAHLYIVNPLKNIKGGVNKLFSTHPPIEERIAALEKM